MTIGIDSSFFKRWSDKSVSATITGGLYQGRVTENPTDVMPYASYDNVTDIEDRASRDSRYCKKTIQISVWDSTRDLVGSHINLIEATFVHSDRAATFPLTSLVAGEEIKDVSPVAMPVILQESADIWMATITFVVEYTKPRNLNPA